MVDSTSPYGLTGAIFSPDRYVIDTALRKLQHAAGNVYVSDLRHCVSAPLCFLTLPALAFERALGWYLLSFPSPSLSHACLAPLSFDCCVDFCVRACVQINAKCTGSVVGQQPFGGARLSGTNDKAGAASYLVRS